MKKIYTMIGQQKLNKNFYGDVNHQLFTKDKTSVYFPITAYLFSIIDDNEKFKVLIVDSFNSSASKQNIKLLNEELNYFFSKTVTIEIINTNFAYDQKGQISTFKKLYKTFEFNDEIYFDITFGLKPTPMTIFVTCNYAQKFIENVSIKSMIYAHYSFEADDSYVHPIIDITSLFLLNNLIDTLSQMQSSDPTKFIDSIFKIDEE